MKGDPQMVGVGQEEKLHEALKRVRSGRVLKASKEFDQKG